MNKSVSGGPKGIKKGDKLTKEKLAELSKI